MMSKYIQQYMSTPVHICFEFTQDAFLVNMFNQLQCLLGCNVVLKERFVWAFIGNNKQLIAGFVIAIHCVMLWSTAY